MAKLTFTTEELSRYFNGQVKHKAYNETVNMATDMKIHAEGVYPKKMIEERRPSESLAVKAYREKIWKPVTKPVFSKVITELNKIRRSPEWSIKFDASKVPPRINAEETMQKYCEEQYPDFASVTNWVFSVLLAEYCKDANAVVAVMPYEKQILLNEYSKPFGFLYGSECVIDFVQNDYAVIKSTDKVVYTNDQGTKWYGDVYYIFTTQSVQRWEQTNGTQQYALKWEYQHGIGKLPVFRVKGVFKKALDSTFVYESRLSAMLPRLDEALREYSDLQAEVVQQIFTERWEYGTDECAKCKGKGKVVQPGFTGSEMDCPTCEGSGTKPRGPYTMLRIKPVMAGEKTMPTPPMGIVEKSVEIVKVQDERFDKHLYQALSAINMEYLHQSPLNQSGTAKEVDKDALNNFVNAVAEDLVAVMDQLYYFICEYRYRIIVPDEKTRALLRPAIKVPEKYDLLSSTYLESQIAKQKENKGNPMIINALEEDYVSKKFTGDTQLQQKVMLSIRLDPLAGVSEDDRMTRLSNRGITEETYIISCNIREFIDRAIDEKGEAFFSMKLKDQRELMTQYATEQVKATSTAGTILTDLESESVDPKKVNPQAVKKNQAEPVS